MLDPFIVTAIGLVVINLLAVSPSRARTRRRAWPRCSVSAPYRWRSFQLAGSKAEHPLRGNRARSPDDRSTMPRRRASKRC
jgi:hypothetical protein